MEELSGRGRLRDWLSLAQRISISSLAWFALSEKDSCIGIGPCSADDPGGSVPEISFSTALDIAFDELLGILFQSVADLARQRVQLCFQLPLSLSALGAGLAAFARWHPPPSRAVASPNGNGLRGSGDERPWPRRADHVAGAGPTPAPG